ncbi:MAG TPA: peptide-methionine (R)-S-oxide reductase MsrB [Acidimicrobiia bacterium]|nr:peptide-methionine (R)-S-oxide reductase MsrB [Acidimicrobiia bacterium]
MTEIPRSEDEWRVRLDPDRFRVLREGATERPFSGAYVDEKRTGTYGCAGCGTELFSSDAKYDSRSGWPSFYEALDPSKIEERTDTSHGMVRTEIVCAACGGHLGHLFPDGPAPTGLRYCVNSLSLELDPEA